MKEVFVLELKETRAKRIHDPRVVTFYYQGLHRGFTTIPEKAMEFESAEAGFKFISDHGLFSCECVRIKKSRKDRE